MAQNRFGVHLPRSQVNGDVQLVPSSSALASTASSSISTATNITLNGSTQIVEITAIDQGVFMKYAAGVTTSSNGFDEFIPADSVRHYVIPDGVTVISVIERAATASVIVIEK